MIIKIEVEILDQFKGCPCRGNSYECQIPERDLKVWNPNLKQDFLTHIHIV